ncbi:MAG: 4'-phosphopantetheinyl transferase superfamily protein [Proteobacteria bacterium]|nr:4'-phosphopantetheinyl transferase superfamily protein [Pseudomonadota bacterium]
MNHDGPLGRFFLPPDFDKINDFKVMKKQVEWMAGKVAVKTLASILKLCPESSLLIDAEKSGAPFLPDFPHISISISHSGDYAVAAMDTRGLGLALDIEAIEQGRMKNIMGVAFSEKEISLYKDHEDSTLYLNWTVKEAFLKYIKKGFAEGLKKVEIIDGAVVHRGSPVTDIRIDTRILYTDYAFTLIRSIPK